MSSPFTGLPAIEQDLRGNLLPFWMTRAIDDVHGGFYGALTNNLEIHNEAPRTAILYGRILWTFATAARVLGDPAYLATAERARDYILRCLWDGEHDGVYWAVDVHGQPLDDRKHSYAQAFVLYGLAAHYRATGNADSLRRAQGLYRRLEAHAFDPVHLGYIEGCSRAWGPLADMRLSAKEPNCRKSMNTLLHILEAYTELGRSWADTALRASQKQLIEVFLRHVIDPPAARFRLFFEDDWLPLADHVSPGHDIEGSWLLMEAAEGLGDAELLAQVRQAALRLAQTVYDHGRDGDGSVVYEQGPDGTVFDRHWWVQAEAVVGFYNAYQISGQAHFAQGAQAVWDYIAAHLIDREDGEWIKVVDRAGRPRPDVYKVGPWECPYHSSRMGFEMMARLTKG